MLDTISSLRLFKGALGTEVGLEVLVAQHMRPVDIAPGTKALIKHLNTVLYIIQACGIT